MGKRYKKGNHKSKKKQTTNKFYTRERTINRLIHKFVKDFFNLQRPAIREEYEDMNQQRLEIKRLFRLQEEELWKQSRRRRRFYYQQLSKFKYYYTAWKYFTYYIYLESRYDCPLHLSTTLRYYITNSHNISSTIYML